MKKVLMGNHAVSHAVRLARTEVISAYPITPQTQIVEMLSEFCAEGSLAARFIKVESEHSAMAACIGAASAGARTFTATSSQGLLLMHELLHWAAGARLPIVLANVNRAVGAGWNVWDEQTDSLAQRDTGWIQLYCESNQEVLDTVLHAFRLAEAVRLPAMINLDAFILSHTEEPVDVPDADRVDAFLPRCQAPYWLDPEHPRAFNLLVGPEVYMEMRLKIEEAMQSVPATLAQIETDFNARWGRRYGPVEAYRLEGAEMVVVCMGATCGTVRVVVDELRAQGKPVGLLKLRLFRPFPVAEVRGLLAGLPRVTVVDRNISFGQGGIIAAELKAALYGLAHPPQVYDFVVGLGGRDITPATVHGLVDRAQALAEPPMQAIWWEVRA